MSKIQKILLVLALLATGVVGWVVYDNRERPLGEGFEYLGKKDMTCWWLVCDSNPGVYYYYGTDFGEEEVVKKFDATLIDSYNGTGAAGPSTTIITSKGGKDISITTYQIGKYSHSIKLKPTNRKQIFRIKATDYEHLK